MTAWPKRFVVSVLGLIFFVALVENCTPPPHLRSGYQRGGNRAYAGGSSVRKRIIHLALRQRGTPYKWGGKRPGGFDCSGFVGYVYYKATRISLPRRSDAQATRGRRVRRPAPGDLLFFHTFGRRISHVAIYLGRGKFIHAPGRGKVVRVDSIGNPYWKRAYRFSKRLL